MLDFPKKRTSKHLRKGLKGCAAKPLLPPGQRLSYETTLFFCRREIIAPEFLGSSDHKVAEHKKTTTIITRTLRMRGKA